MSTFYDLATTLPEALRGPLIDSPRAGAGERWTLATNIPIETVEIFPSRVLQHVRRNLSGEERVASLMALSKLPPIEIAVAPDGRVRLMDGGHRLVTARRRGDRKIAVQFLIVKKSDDRFLGPVHFTSSPESP